MNEYIVLTCDALLHVGVVLLMVFLVSFIVKVCSRGQVDFKLVGGTLVILMAIIIKMFLERQIADLLPGIAPDILLGIMALAVFVTSVIMVYWQYAVPILGALLGSVFIVLMIFGSSYGTPKLSLYLMPEGQRFAEFAGIASDQTNQLMERAKHFENKASDKSLWDKALAALSFFTSEEEQEQLSKDFASGMELYRQRKEYMDNMSEEELAEYRAAMSTFLQEQGLAENRYDMNNIKNATPEDMANLATFMQELSGEFDIEIEKGNEGAIVPSAESLSQISANLHNAKMSDQERSIFERVMGLVNNGELTQGLQNARAEIVDLKKSLPEGSSLVDRAKVLNMPMRNLNFGSNAAERIEIIDTKGTVIVDEAETLNDAVEVNNKIVSEFDPSKYTAVKQGLWVLHVSKDLNDYTEWKSAVEAIPYRAWFSAEGVEPVYKLVLEDIVLSSGDHWQFKYNDDVYVFLFDQIDDEGIHITAIKKL
ncbi:MAG: hypothetical protein ACSHX8_05800 [Opitutaceae bacterium]